MLRTFVGVALGNATDVRSVIGAWNCNGVDIFGAIHGEGFVLIVLGAVFSLEVC